MSARRKRLVGLVFCLGLLLAPLGPAPFAAAEENPEAEETGAEASQAPPAAEAEAVVDGLHAVMLEVMKHASDLGFQGRYDRLGPAMKERFDLAYMAAKSVGRHWKTATSAERERLLASFERYIIATYASRFTGFDDQRFETLKLEDSIHGTVLVYSQVVEKSGEAVQLTYRLHPVDGRWRIVDVYLNGSVSELALRRSEYAALIKKEGMEGLLAALDAKTAELASTPSS